MLYKELGVGGMLIIRADSKILKELKLMMTMVT